MGLKIPEETIRQIAMIVIDLVYKEVKGRELDPEEAAALLERAKQWKLEPIPIPDEEGGET